MLLMYFFFFFKQKTAYEMRISDWSSDVCSSDLRSIDHLRDVQSPTPNSRQNRRQARNLQPSPDLQTYRLKPAFCSWLHSARFRRRLVHSVSAVAVSKHVRARPGNRPAFRSDEHTSELKSLIRISYAVICLKQ